MSKIKIVTDSTSDIPKEILDKHNVVVVPLMINIDGELYADGVDISAKEFLSKMEKSKQLPKSSQPSAGQFVEIYNELAKDGSEILSLHMTAKMSGTFTSAETAAHMVDANVTVINSAYISCALGFQVLEAAKMAEEGKSMKEIVERLDTIRKNSRLFIMLDTLDNMVKGGRIGKATAMVGSILNIKPIAHLDTGEVTQAAKVRSHSQMVKYLVKQLVEDTKGKIVKGMGIAHAGCPDLAEKLKNAVQEATDFRDTQIVYTTPAISTHAGPGAIALMYFAE